MSFPERVESIRAGQCHLLVYGQGARVFVGFHGWSGSSESFHPLLSYLPENVSFFAFDLPGAGQSPPPPRWSTDVVVDRLESAFDTLNLRAVDIVAASGGVGFATQLAVRRPDLVARLVLIDPFAFFPWYFRIFTLSGVGRLLYYLTFANPVGRWITDLSLASRRTQASSLMEGFAEARHAENHGHLLALEDAARVPLRDLAGFSGPVDIVHGDRTFRAVKRSVEMLREPYPSAELFVVDGAGHLPMHEATEAVARVVFAPVLKEARVGRAGDTAHGSAPANAV